ncbi:MAG: sensor histidine kinase [Thermomicrobiales bacterium]
MHTIRGKLSLAFLLIIAVCLIPTSAAAAYVIRYYQRQDAIERLSSFGQTVAGAANARQFTQFTPTEIVNLFNAQKSSNVLSNVLVVYTDARGVEQADSENKYVGTTWPVSANQPDSRTSPLRPAYQGRFTTPDGVSFAVATYRVDRRRTVAAGNPPTGVPADQQAVASFIIVAAPQSALSDAWSVIIGRLMWIVIAALLVSLLVAFILSRSLTSRLQTLTQGANAMANGDYDRAMRLANVRSSNDEIGDLANAFQTMATNVARAQQAQRELVANVSHELKTPLTSIQGFSQAMIDGTVTSDTDYEDLAQIIQQESQRMRRLVEQMLELSRLESGTVRLDVAPLRVDELVENVGKRYARLGEAKGITVRWASPHNLIMKADAGRLEQVLVNLLDNALQYTDTGGQVTVSARAARPNRVAFVIEDTGRGISPDDVPRLFERFYQVERSRTGQGKHVGLGLAIVREIVDGHQGEIAVDSRLGAGTTIVVTIPNTVSTAARADVYRPVEKYAADSRATAAS